MNSKISPEFVGKMSYCLYGLVLNKNTMYGFNLVNAAVIVLALVNLHFTQYCDLNV